MQRRWSWRSSVAKSGLPYGLTHTYAGYALVREARAICAAGQLGKIRKIAVEYLQGWLSQPIETTGQKQAAWRSDPAQNGPGGCIGDIGMHAFHLLEYVTGLQVTGSECDAAVGGAGTPARRRLHRVAAH